MRRGILQMKMEQIFQLYDREKINRQFWKCVSVWVGWKQVQAESGDMAAITTEQLWLIQTCTQHNLLRILQKIDVYVSIWSMRLCNLLHMTIHTTLTWDIGSSLEHRKDYLETLRTLNVMYLYLFIPINVVSIKECMHLCIHLHGSLNILHSRLTLRCKYNLVLPWRGASGGGSPGARAGTRAAARARPRGSPGTPPSAAGCWGARPGRGSPAPGPRPPPWQSPWSGSTACPPASAGRSPQPRHWPRSPGSLWHSAEAGHENKSSHYENVFK